MISNAKDTLLSLNPGTLPNVQDAMSNWFQSVTFIKVVTETINGQACETETEFNFQGIVESATPQQLMMKPEGQRDWNWKNVWAYPDVILQDDDILIYQGTRYRVQSRHDWKEYGYLSYDLVEDYE